MGKSQRTKGASYEREVAHVFELALGEDFGRNIGQARDGANDLDVGPLVIECKRRKTLKTLRDWMDQAIASIPTFKKKNRREYGYPVVVMREDNGPSMVLIRLTDFLMLTRDVLEDNIHEHTFGPELARQIRSAARTTIAQQVGTLADDEPVQP